MKCRYTSAPDHIIDCIGFMRSIYWLSFLISAHEVIGISGIYMAFEGHIFSGTYMVKAWKIKLYFVGILLLCAVKRGLHVDNIISGVGCTCAMWQTYLFKDTSINVKFKHTSASGDIVYCSGFI